MFAGVELGLDAPSFALHLHVFSDIFLRLVKTIVAPLILGTLISGIAAHGSLKEVGRLGIKSLIYFEISNDHRAAWSASSPSTSPAPESASISPLRHQATADDRRAIPAVASPHSRRGAAEDPAAAQSAIPRWDQFLLHVFPETPR